MTRIGIRREDKSTWEGRAPLVPDDIEKLVREHGLEISVQKSARRAIAEELYDQVGARVEDELRDCDIIMGVKEIPLEKIEPGKTYIYFSHTIKGQPANMPALAKILDGGGTLIDYERVTDSQGRRLVFFGRFAGLAGMIDTLWTLGRRLTWEGKPENPFACIQPAHAYADLEAVRGAMGELARSIREQGLPSYLQPFVCGFAGYGQASSGAQEIFDLLPFEEIAPEDLGSLPKSAHTCFKVVFREHHMVRRIDTSSDFELQEYYDHPELYADDFFRHSKHLTLLMNCIYWESKYPRLLSRNQFRDLYGRPDEPRLKVVGDISCDIDGSLACTLRCTGPESPVYVYDPVELTTIDGVEGRGPVVLAVDFLPCELPVDASTHFSRSLAPFVGDLARADWNRSLEESGLPPELARATIVYRGALTEPYRYLQQYLDA